MPKSARRVYVIGTSGLAREMAQLLEQLGQADRFAGFISESAGDAGRDLGFGSVVGDDEWLLGSSREADVVFGIGYPAMRARVIERYLRASDRFGFPNLVHPTAVLDVRRVGVGRGNVITAGCIFTTDVVVGDFNLFNWQTTVGHDARIGDCCVLNPNVNVSGGVSIGDRVLIGTGAQILEGRSIGDGATVGAGAVVTHDVAPLATVMGIPARVVD